MFRTLFYALAATAMLGACASAEIPYSVLDARYGLTSSHILEAQPGLRVHYTDEGPASAPALILVHGFAASVYAWQPWAERLKPDYRLIAIDLPGHGLTEAPAGYRATIEQDVALIDRIAREAGVAHFVLVGNSMGGAVSIAYALAHPERLDGLVLVDAAGWPGEEGQAEGGAPFPFSLLSNDFGRAILKLFDPRLFAVSGLKAAYLDETLVTDALVNRYVDFAMARGHRDILLTQQSSPATPVTPADFARITTPTLVMAGQQDKLIPVAQSRAIAAAIPHSTLVIYPDGGHVPMEQLPDISAKDLRIFLARRDVAGGRQP